MLLKVIAPDLKWQGKRLLRGEKFAASTDRDQKLADLLVKLQKVEAVPEARPVGHVATTAPARKADVEAPVVDQPEPLDLNRKDYITKGEIVAELDRLEIEHDPDATRAELLDLLKGEAE